MDLENLPLHSGVKHDGCARNSQQMSEGAQSRNSIPEVKRAKVMLPSRTLSTESMPRTGTKCHPPNLLEKFDQNKVKDKSSFQQALVTTENDVPRTECDSPCLEQVEPRRPGLRPRVRQSIISMCFGRQHVLYYSYDCSYCIGLCGEPRHSDTSYGYPNRPSHTCMMLLSADIREWKDAKRKNLRQ